MGKFVSEAFKETHNKEWKAMNTTNNDVISVMTAVYSTPQRWQKAIQHLRDAGEIEDSAPRHRQDHERNPSRRAQGMRGRNQAEAVGVGLAPATQDTHSRLPGVLQAVTVDKQFEGSA